MKALLPLLLFVLACQPPRTSGGDGGAPIDAGTSDAGRLDAGHLDAGHADAGSPATDAGQGPPALLRIHYPVATHALTVRGSGGGLSWTAGTATVNAGSDIFTFMTAALAAPIEWKPLLDDTTWSRGPNYRASPGETVEIWPHFTTVAGQVVTLIATFHSNTLNNDRAIYAYLPASYNENTDATFPVLYMHDGQNLWAALPQLATFGTWNVDTAFDNATEHGACSTNGLTGWAAQPFGAAPATCNGDGDCPSNECRTFPEAIVIGIANTATRDYEYTPDNNDPANIPDAGGGPLYLQMIVQELKPQIDAMLRTRPGVRSTAMAGSSLGGLITAYAGLTYPQTLGSLGELSPSSWWANDEMSRMVLATPAAPNRPLVVYIDSGATQAADDELDTDLLAQAYLDAGYLDGVNFRHVIQAGAQHSETYWAQRFPGAMQLVMGVR